MKIVLIDGIQNPSNSMTRELVNSCLEGIKAAKPDAEIKIVKLDETPISFCIGCKKCGANDGKLIGTCVHRDAMDTILPDLIAADRVIFASPIYSFTTSSLMARFGERTLPLCIYPENSWPKSRTKKKPGKKGLVLLCSDCPAPFNWLMGITWHASILLRMICGGVECSKTKVLSAGGMRNRKAWFDKFKNKAFVLGKNWIAS
jgi:hypothetical protein